MAGYWRREGDVPIRGYTMTEVIATGVARILRGILVKAIVMEMTETSSPAVRLGGPQIRARQTTRLRFVTEKAQRIALPKLVGLMVSGGGGPPVTNPHDRPFGSGLKIGTRQIRTPGCRL